MVRVACGSYPRYASCLRWLLFSDISGAGHKSMGRFIVLFLIVCSILMFLLVLQTPPQVLRNSYIYQKVFKSAEPEAEVAAEPPAERQKPGKRKVLGVTTRSVEIMAPTTPPPAGAQPVPAAPPANEPAKQPTGNLAVSSEAPVYSSNSPSSTVLQVLNKGQIVEVDFEVITASGKWTLVTIPRQNVSGFVKSDGIFMTPSGEQSRPIPQGAQ
jgi:hypothetical protein